jgi:hypothetical protein
MKRKTFEKQLVILSAAVCGAFWMAYAWHPAWFILCGALTGLIITCVMISIFETVK